MFSALSFAVRVYEDEHITFWKRSLLPLLMPAVIVTGSSAQMITTKSIFLFIVLLLGVDANSSLCLGDLYAGAASWLARYQPAQQPCSQYFPVPGTTTKIIAPTQTAVMTISIATFT